MTKKKFRARPGFEPGTSRTQSENHAPRPTSLHWDPADEITIKNWRGSQVYPVRQGIKMWTRKYLHEFGDHALNHSGMHSFYAFKVWSISRNTYKLITRVITATIWRWILKKEDCCPQQACPVDGVPYLHRGLSVPATFVRTIGLVQLWQQNTENPTGTLRVRDQLGSIPKISIYSKRIHHCLC